VSGRPVQAKKKLRRLATETAQFAKRQ